MNLAPNNPNPGSILIENLRSFLHLTTQTPFEVVCKSALYLLSHVPATRPAVFEYIGTFYKIATYLHIRYIFSLKSQPNRDFTAELQNITHINQVLDLIETSVGELFRPEAINELWSLELLQWLIDLIGDIVSNNGVVFTDQPGLSIEETTLFKNLSLIDALELWSIQCKPTKSILNLIRKCYQSVQDLTKFTMFDIIFTASNKYSSQFDWILCDFSAFNSEFIFESCLKCGYKEFTQTNKLNRINVINYYALNFSTIVKNVISTFMDEQASSNDTKKSFLTYILALSSVCPALTNLMLNEILSEESEYAIKCFQFMNDSLISSSTSTSNLDLTKYFIECLKQLGNNIAAYDLLSRSIEWVDSFANSDLNLFILNLIVSIIQLLIFLRLVLLLF